MSDPAPRLFSAYLLNASGEAREAQLAYALRHGYGVEIRDFGWSRLLDDPAACDRLVQWYRDRLPQVRGPVTLHGPTGDLSFGGADAQIVAVSHARVRACLEVATGLGVSRVIFHTTFHHPDPQPWYVTAWITRQAAFWQEALAGRPTEVLLENAWEPGPEVLRDAIDAIALPQVAACFDIGHAHLHQRTIPPARWIEILGHRLRHLHLHDNLQTYDQHLLPGGGSIDWGSFAAALRAAGLCLPAVLEVEGEERLAAGVRLLERL